MIGEEEGKESHSLDETQADRVNWVKEAQNFKMYLWRYGKERSLVLEVHLPLSGVGKGRLGWLSLEGRRGFGRFGMSCRHYRDVLLIFVGWIQ